MGAHLSILQPRLGLFIRAICYYYRRLEGAQPQLPIRRAAPVSPPIGERHPLPARRVHVHVPPAAGALAHSLVGVSAVDADGERIAADADVRRCDEVWRRIDVGLRDSWHCMADA